VCSFRCEGTSPEIPDFPETPEKSPEYPRFTDKFVSSGDFQDSPIHPPLGDIKIFSVVLSITRNKRAGDICINIRAAGPIMGELETRTMFKYDNDTL
jgi:hypothetical protein